MKKEKDFSKRKPEGHSRLERTDMEPQSWVYAPTRLSIQIMGADGDVISLTEQQILQGINAKLQPYIRTYFENRQKERKEIGTDYADKEKEKFQPLFLPSDVSLKNGDAAVPNTPLMEFDATDIVDRAHFSRLREYANKMLNIKVDIKASEDILDRNGVAAKSGRNLPLEYRRESIFPLFSKIELETTGEKHEQMVKGATDSGELKSFESYTGKMVAKINPEISNYLFNMRAGVIEQPRFLAKYAKCKYTPIFYSLLKRQIGINQVDTVDFDYTHVKRWANLPPDETGPRKKDADGKSIKREWHNMYSRFREKVLEEVRYDLIQMCERNHSDLYIDYEPIYRTPGVHKGSPVKIRFYLFLSYVGERRKEYKRTKKLEPSLFSEPIFDDTKQHIQEIHPETSKNNEVNIGEYKELWDQLMKEYEGPEKYILLRSKYIGTCKGRFYVSITKNDLDLWNSIDKSGIEKAARTLLKITSIMPPFYMKTIYNQD